MELRIQFLKPSFKDRKDTHFSVSEVEKHQVKKGHEDASLLEDRGLLSSV
jgi:hypothetical protein